MHKPPVTLIKILDNPERKATSMKRARQFVGLGLADWVVDSVSIRFKNVQAIRAQSRADDDQRYWMEIARQKGSSGEVFCSWRPKYSDGYSVMQATVGVDAKTN